MIQISCYADSTIFANPNIRYQPMNSGTVLNSCTIGLDQCKCFEKLTKEEQSLVEKHQVEVRFKKGEMICKQGTFAPHIMYLIDGLVKIYVEGPNESLILKIIAPGNLIAISSAFEGNQVFQYSAQAYVESTVRFIDVNVFRHLLKQNAVFASEVVNVLSINTIQIYARFYCLVNKQSYGRLADVLLCVSERVFRSPRFEFPISRKELGELTGLATESVIRMIRKFKDEGLIEEDGKIMEILNPEKLREISLKG
jgi:CRP/FNR family transcriptional regulator, polysaccharide utilization system transcription regulator